MSNAFLFPGQGSQNIGMGELLYNELPEAAAVLDQANEILGYDLKALMFSGPEESLTDTRFAQPAIFTCSAMHLEKAKREGISFDYVAGHSLGEYSALYAAGVFSFEDGLKLVDKRGKAMSEENGKGIMAAVLGLKEQELAEYLTDNIVMANLNTPSQIVVSGDTAEIEALISRLTSREDVKTVKLNVSAAFHSPQMIKAEESMRKVIEDTVFMEPACFVVSNVTGTASKDVSQIKSNLISQITGQVRWYDSIITMRDAGIEQFYECGNGQVLRKMNRAITLRPKCLSV